MTATDGGNADSSQGRDDLNQGDEGFPQNAMTRQVVTVTPNPAMDLTYQFGAIRPGESHRVNSPMARAGGKGINVARVLHQLHHPALAIAPVGGCTGADFRTELELARLPHRLVEIAGETRRSIALVETAMNRTSIFNEAGAPLSSAEWCELTTMAASSLTAQSGTRVLVGSGSLPPMAPEDFYAELVTRAHLYNIPTVVDTSGPGMLRAAEAGADLLKPNESELLEATDEYTVLAAAWRLLELGARTVLVSMGAEGMLAFSHSQSESYLRARLPNPLRGNPTGAGDAAVAAAAWTLASGPAPLERILRTATAWSAAAVLMGQAGEISPLYDELEKIVKVTEEKWT